MKAALDVTPAQEALWDKVAGAMRENDRETQQLYDKLQSDPTQPQTAVQRAELQLESAELGTQEVKDDATSLTREPPTLLIKAPPDGGAGSRYEMDS